MRWKPRFLGFAKMEGVGRLRCPLFGFQDSVPSFFIDLLNNGSDCFLEKNSGYLPIAYPWPLLAGLKAV